MLFRSLGKRLLFEICRRFDRRVADGGHKIIHFKRFQVNLVEMVDRLEVDREGIVPPMMTAQHPMTIIIEGSEAANIIPNPFVGGMKDMRAVAVEFNIRLPVRFGIAIPADVIALFDDQYVLPQLAGDPFGNDRAGEAAPNDDIGIIPKFHLSKIL